MRQAGVIAAGALYALENNVERLAEDHANAQLLATTIRNLPDVELRPEQVDTNIVVFHVAPVLGTSAEVAARLRDRGLLVAALARPWWSPRLLLGAGSFWRCGASTFADPSAVPLRG